MSRHYKPVVVEVGDELYEVYLGGRPGVPRVYRRTRSGQRRVLDEGELLAVAGRLRSGVDERRAREQREAGRREGWWFRLGQALRRALGG